MKLIRGWYMPDHETELLHATAVLKQEGYQINQRRWSLEGLQQHRTALDIGAHVGLWARDLCGQFLRVIAFEPHPEHRQCLAMNVKAPNLEIVAAAVGERDGMCSLQIYPGRSGHTHRKEGTDVRLISIDTYAPEEVDYIKIDVEGFEYEVLLGAEETIMRDHPRIVIEQKQQHHRSEQERYRASDLLLSWGYQRLRHHGDDHVFGWPR